MVDLKKTRGRICLAGEDADLSAVMKNLSELSAGPEEAGNPSRSSRRKGRSQPGMIKVLVAGDNFGCGMCREEAVNSLKKAGVFCIIARSFDRSFFRDAINRALPSISADLIGKACDGSEIEIDYEKGIIRLPESEVTFSPLPEIFKSIIIDGGLISHVKKNISR